jgi:predicted ester cyclase
MSVEENKTLIRQVYDYCNNRELEAYFALFAPGYIFHSVDGDLPLEQAIQHEREWFVAFPDVQATIMDIVAEDDKVAVRVNWKGTHLGNGYGWTPSGKKIDITNANTFRIADGKLRELWNVCDMHFLLQLGYTKSE